MQQPPSILVYGRDAGLLLSRTWVFQAAGFQAAAVANLASVKKAAAGHIVDLLVVCHTLSAQEFREVLAWADTVPSLKRMILAAGALPCALPPNELVLSQFAGARELVASAHRLLPAGQPA